jgi:hypothetical protein
MRRLAAFSKILCNRRYGRNGAIAGKKFTGVILRVHAVILNALGNFLGGLALVGFLRTLNWMSKRMIRGNWRVHLTHAVWRAERAFFKWLKKTSLRLWYLSVRQRKHRR